LRRAACSGSVNVSRRRPSSRNLRWLRDARDRSATSRGRFVVCGTWSGLGGNGIGSIYFLCKATGVVAPSKSTLMLLGERPLPIMVPVVILARGLRAIPSSFSLQRRPVAKSKSSSVINHIGAKPKMPHDAEPLNQPKRISFKGIAVQVGILNSGDAHARQIQRFCCGARQCDTGAYGMPCPRRQRWGRCRRRWWRGLRGGIIGTGSLGGRRFRAGLRFAAAFGALLVPGRHRLAVLAADTKNAAAVVMAPDSIVVRPQAIAIPKRAPQHSSFLWLGLRSY
jgi:hypothetical protein